MAANGFFTITYRRFSEMSAGLSKPERPEKIQDSAGNPPLA